MRPLVPSTKLAKTPQELRGVRGEPAGLSGAAVRDHDENLAESGLHGRVDLPDRRIRSVEDDVDRSAQGRGVASDLRAGLIERPRRVDRLREPAGVGIPDIGVPRGKAEHAFALRADPDRRVWAVHRLWSPDPG